MATGLVAVDNPTATGDALRGLRQAKAVSGPLSVTTEQWRVFSFPPSSLAGRPNWRFIPPRAEAALNRLRDNGAKRLAEVFDVKQGVRTGRNPVFVLNTDQLRSLPKKEHIYFRPAVMNESLEGGRIHNTHWVFYPHRPEGGVFASEEALFDAVPTYSKRFLQPQRTALSRRANITRATRTDWWGLSEPRNTWALRGEPRLVSKYFGGAGGFAADQAGAFVVVQGFGWLPKWIKFREVEEDEEEALGTSNQDGLLLSAYVALFNSALFSKLLELHSAYVAGGQYDLSPRYVDHIPVPLLVDLLADERMGAVVVSLARLGEAPDPLSRSWASEAARLSSALYGGLEIDHL